MNDTERDPHPLDSAVDARIDAVARSAGREFRRPAPTDGLDRAHRSRRQQYVVRAAVTGVAAVAIVAVGAIILSGRQGGDTLAPATIPESTVPASTVPVTTVPNTTVANTVSDSIPPATTDVPQQSVPTGVSVPPNSAGAPSAVYTADTFAGASATQTLVDPVTGAVLSSGPVDAIASRDAQDGLLGRTWMDGRLDVPGHPGVIGYRYELGGATLSTERLPSETPYLEDQDQTALPRFDRCGQSELIVTGVSDTSLPARVHEVVVSADGRWIVTVASDCPEAGTLLDGYTQQRYAAVYQLFDAADLAAPGRTLPQPDSEGGIELAATFSPDGRFVAVGSSFFATATGDPIAVPVGGCSVAVTRHGRLIGPWIGDSSIALQLECGDTKTLLVRDLATQEELRFDLPQVSDAGWFVADVDHAHYDRPSNVWFTLCDLEAPACWLGQGGGELVELPGVVEASFLPLGFTYGG